MAPAALSDRHRDLGILFALRFCQDPSTSCLTPIGGKKMIWYPSWREAVDDEPPPSDPGSYAECD
jgi:hypothetical protein